MVNSDFEDASADEQEDENTNVADGNVLEDSTDEEEEREQPGADAEVEPTKGKAAAARKRKPKRRRNVFIDDAAEEDDDEEETAAPRGKAQKGHLYIDDIAQQSRDGEEEEESSEEDLEGIIAADGDADIAQGHNHQRFAEQRRRQEDMTEEELEKFAERYERQTYQVQGSSDGGDIGVVGQQGLQPTSADARLWAIQIRPGCEREAVVCIMTKAVQFAGRAEQLGMAALGIKAVFCQDHLPGYIWVETHKLDNVKDALRGFRFVFHSKPVTLVKLTEMVDTITVPKPKEQLLDIGAWVRVKTNPIYGGDIGRVVDVDYQKRRATIEVVPRLDYTAMAAARAQTSGRKASSTRQPPRPFNVAEGKERGCEVAVVGSSLIDAQKTYEVDGKYLLRGGYLLKSFPLKSLLALEGLPPMGELTQFKQAASGEEGADAGGLQALMGSLKGQEAPPTVFVKGDKIRVVAGELVGALGFVEKVDEDGILHMRATSLDKSLVVEVDRREVEKHFEAGDRVKAVSGQHSGETGMLVVLDDDGIAVLILDSSQTEARMFARDLTLSKERNVGIDRLGQYEQHDLVQLVDVVGVIVECGADTAKVLTSGGRPDRPEIRTVRLPDIKKRAGSRNAVTNDLGLQPVGIGDMVDVKRGSMSDKSGTVKFIKANNLFLHSREVKTHGGFFCVNARDCRVRGGKPSALGGSSAATPNRVADILAGLRSPGPNRTPGGVMGSPQLGSASQMSLTGTAGNSSFGGRTGGSRADDSLLGRTLKIMKGPHKSYSGRVVSATETHCRIELEATYRTVTVSRAQLNLGGPSGSSSDASPWNAPVTPSHPGGRTPGAATPMHAWGSATPSHPGSATPSRMPMTPGRETPGAAWNPSSPMRPADVPGTPAWGQELDNPLGFPAGGFPMSPMDLPTPASQYGTPGTAITPGYSPKGSYSPAGQGLSSYPMDTVGGSAPYSPAQPHEGPYTPGMLGTPADSSQGMLYTQQGSQLETPLAPLAGHLSDVSLLWHGIEVETADGRQGVVSEVSPDDVASIFVDADVVSEAVASLVVTPPVRRDRVRVVLEAAAHDAAADDATTRPGTTAILTEIRDQEAVLKLDGQDSSEEFEHAFVTYRRLGRIKDDMQ